MDLDLYCEYARNNNIKCCLSELMVECNKHYIIKTIHDEIPTGKCATFDVDFQANTIKIILINPTSLKREAFVLVDLKYLYNPVLFNYTTNDNTFAYLVYRD
jgi:hypothetical protein